MGAVPDQRRALLHQRGDHDLAHLSVRHGLQGFGIDDLDIEIIIPVVHARIVFAVDADARAVDLRQAVDIVQLDAQTLADALAHLLAPALGADDALLQRILSLMPRFSISSVSSSA